MSPPQLDAGLLLLAGGQSRRMGRPKSLLPAGPGAATLLEWQVRRLGPAFPELLVAGTPELVPAHLHDHLVRDLHLGAGPLAGLEAGLAATAHEVVFAAAVDMPYLTMEVAVRTVGSCRGHDAAVPVAGGRAQPLAAAYGTSAAGAIAAAIAEGRLAVRDVLSELDMVLVEGMDERLFANLNSPGDHRRFLDALRQKT